jgi:NADP-dependent 3-hydroxy acid dehydrogenase YdfG
MGVGYTTEAPGLGEPKEPKGKFKSSGYGDIEKEVKVKSNVKDSLGDSEAKTSMPKKVKEMPDKGVSGVEKKVRLQEEYDSKAGLSKKEQDKISTLSKEEKKALYDDLTDATSDVNDQDFDAVYALNLKAPMVLTQCLLPYMRKAHFGRIVNIASRAALGKEERTAYSATKAGLQGMTRTWALELAQFGITVNAIGPGPIATELFTSGNPPGAPKTIKIVESIPVKRMGQPEDIAHAAAYLMDERASFVTGQTLYVCGGMTVGLSNAS